MRPVAPASYAALAEKEVAEPFAADTLLIIEAIRDSGVSLSNVEPPSGRRKSK